MKCCIGAPLSKETADKFWMLQTKAGSSLSRQFGPVDFSQGSMPFHVNIVEPFEADRFGGVSLVVNRLRTIAAGCQRFEAHATELDAVGVTTLIAHVSPADQFIELRRRVSVVLGLGLTNERYIPRIRLAHDVNERLFEHMECAFDKVFTPILKDGVSPVAIEIGTLGVYERNAREWAPVAEASFPASI